MQLAMAEGLASSSLVSSLVASSLATTHLLTKPFLIFSFADTVLPLLHHLSPKLMSLPPDAVWYEPRYMSLDISTQELINRLDSRTLHLTWPFRL